MVKFLIKNILDIFSKSEGHSPLVKHNGTYLPEVNNWAISEFITKQLVPIIGNRPFPITEIHLLVAATCLYRPTHMFDWGTHIGKSARIFYETNKSFNLNAKIISIDLPDNIPHQEHPHDQRGILVKNFNDVELMLGDGLDTSFKYLSKLDKKLIRPQFFLDGDHSYDTVHREAFAIAKKYSKACIIIHDTFYQIPSSNYNVGPRKVVDELLKTYPTRYFQINSLLGLPGMTVLIPYTELIHK